MSSFCRQDSDKNMLRNGKKCWERIGKNEKEKALKTLFKAISSLFHERFPI